MAGRGGDPSRPVAELSHGSSRHLKGAPVRGLWSLLTSLLSLRLSADEILEPRLISFFAALPPWTAGVPQTQVQLCVLLRHSGCRFSKPRSSLLMPWMA